MEHVGGGPRSGLLKEVDKSHLVVNDAERISLGVLDGIIFGLDLNPRLVDEESSLGNLGMDDGCLLGGVRESGRETSITWYLCLLKPSCSTKAVIPVKGGEVVE